ncbi:MAG: alpha/beta hydrolase [Actinomycetota bacterium]|nr:alpha/beta hydrolase [Actinomycetota bacterium]
MKRSAWGHSLGRVVAVALAAALGLGAFATSGGAVQSRRRTGGSDEGLPPVQTGPLVVRDIPYAQHGGQILRLDVYWMEGAEAAPGLVLVHGGSWRRRSKETWSTLASLYAREGYVVFAIDYRLAPPGGAAQFPDPVADVAAAVDWVRRNAGTYGVDAARVGVAGSSAGAQLALMAAAGPAETRPDAVALFSAPVDLERLHRMDVLRRPIENYLGCSPDVCPPTYRSASGRRALDTAAPPMLVAYARDELIPRDQPRRLMKRLEALGRPFAGLELRGTRHGMAVASATVDETIAFLNAHL